jgi:hypothetical protein
MATREVLYHEPIEKINRFDILIADVYAGDDYTTIDGTENITMQEVWDWLSTGGDWNFRVTAHGQPDKIFLRGFVALNGMRDAVAGEALVRLGEVTKDELDELYAKIRSRRREEFAAAEQPKKE